jgi:putative transposase
LRLVDTIWRVTDELWALIFPVFQKRYPASGTGRPRADFRRVLDGIIFRLRSGCQWNQLPAEFGADSTVHQWFQAWCRDGVMKEIWRTLAARCEDLGDISWRWQSADGAMGKARLGGDQIGPNPTDRAKNGTKRSLIVEARGGPLGAVIAGANVHDTKLLRATIESMILVRPAIRQHLCLDKGYDNPTGRDTVRDAGYVGHIRRIGEEKAPKHPDGKPRRWVVERTLAWLSKCRALLIRYDKHAVNFLGLLQLACALLWFRRLAQVTG